MCLILQGIMYIYAQNHKKKEFGVLLFLLFGKKQCLGQHNSS